ncbi:MAG: radical SAM protein [Bacteroidales bacterium]|jgi:radical SAM superfamily enzyme YgiQ (UPF0313 family)|nr:radical SAM protein [Bacteroidales bacterium]
MKKVLIINSNTETLPYPVAPLGVSLIASSLEEKYEVKVFDAALNTDKELVQLIRNFLPDFVGVGIRNIDNVTMRRCKWYLPGIKQWITDPVKRNFKGPLILGGSAFSIAPKQMLDYFDADYGIVGEAEYLMPVLLSGIENGRDIFPEKIITKKQHFFPNPTHRNPKLKIPPANIDHFIDYNQYNLRGSYPVQTKRGCAFHCIYCSYPQIEGTRFRLRNIVDIVDEIEEVNQRIPKVTFEFVDSIFNAPCKHAENICKEIIKRGLNVQLRTMGVNPGTVTDELIGLMKEAGFKQIDCTPDSAAEKMLRVYRKNFGKEHLMTCARIIRKYNMPTMWFFMLGGPGETEETILETFDFIDEHISKEDMVHITEGIRIIPNTALYDIALHQGVISKKDSVIEPMFYVNPELGKEKLTKILEREITKRNNVLNSIDTAPSPALMQAAIQYRMENNVQEPMFRTLLRIQNSLKV